MQREKVRIYALARELDMESKDLLDLCRQAGMDVKNQLSSLDPEQRDAVEQMVRKGAGGVAVSAPPKPPSSTNLSAPPGKIPVLTPRRSGIIPAQTQGRHELPTKPDGGQAPVSAPPFDSSAPEVAAQAISPAKPSEPAAPVQPAPTRTASGASSIPASPSFVPTVPAAPPPEPPVAPAAKAPDIRPLIPPGTAAAGPVAAPAETSLPRPPEVMGKLTSLPPQGGKMRDLNQGKTDSGQRGRRERPIPKPAGIRVAAPPPIRQKPPEVKKPQEPPRQKPIAILPKDLQTGKGPINISDLFKGSKTPIAPPAAAVEVEEEEDLEGGDKGKTKRPGGVIGREQRHLSRNQRAQQRKGRESAPLGRQGLLTAEEEPARHHKDRIRKHQQQRRQQGTQPRKGKVPIELPITVRSLSEAVGVRSVDLLFRLREHDLASATINSIIEPVMAEAIALDLGCELEIKRAPDMEEQLLSQQQQPDNAEDLQPRAPVVTIMGHVDHGKTSLLDRIRQSNVAATETGGITQVIRAWRVLHHGRPITFLDTPGHEAFTKMRARGANVTDIAVIVVAADDGVMPQTEEAISHAKAAGVSVVMAINKVDLPSANVNRTRQQLYSLGMIPDNMGGDIPFVETSAASGVGIEDLLENILLVADVKELKANPHKPARGVCLEAMLSEGQGVLATLLVQDGTLNRGDIILCGASFGRVRAMFDDLGHPGQEAGPSVPVRITGLDEVPNADDSFQVVTDLAVAREIAEKRQSRQQDAAVVRREPMRLETLSEIKVTELKVILKADFRGSIEAIRKELEKLHHEEVRVRLLHAAIGGITESDVQLALTSPQDTIIVGFNVIPDDRARQLAEDRGVQIREYNIIYNLTDDIRSALEGKLKPREEIVHLGRAVVSETFKISRVGTIAGCRVTQGSIERSAKVQIVRDGVIIYPPAERTAGLESLKRYKEDVKEVRQGFECGLKIAGYDDIKVGDVIVAYRIEQVQRTLS